jgi:hypothetical protein
MALQDYPVNMTKSDAFPVKQCHAEPSLNWLRALLTDAPPVPVRDEAIRQVIDEGLGPLISQRLGNACPALIGTAQQLAMRELAHQQALQKLASACTTQGLEVLLIKGEALARSLHTTACVRTRSDIDLWVKPGQLDALTAVLQALGYPAITSIRQNWARFEVVHGQSQPPSVAFDVHVTPFFRPRLWPQRPFAAVWSESKEMAGLAPLRTPRISDSFAIAALHLAKNPHKRWIWLYDIDRFCALHPDAVIEVCGLAPDWGVATLVTDALTRAVAVFDTALPCALPRPRRSEPSASLLTRPHKLAALARDLRLLPDWRARLAFVHELFERM